MDGLGRSPVSEKNPFIRRLRELEGKRWVWRYPSSPGEACLAWDRGVDGEIVRVFDADEAGALRFFLWEYAKARPRPGFIWRWAYDGSVESFNDYYCDNFADIHAALLYAASRWDERHTVAVEETAVEEVASCV